MDHRYPTTQPARQQNPRSRAVKRKKEAEEKRRKAIENGDSVPPVATPLLTISAITGTTQDIPKPLLINAAKPVASIDQNAVHFRILDDTLWVDLEPPRIYFPDSLKPMQMRIDYEWEPGDKYRLSVDSLGITDIYGESNGPFNHEFTVRKVRITPTFSSISPGWRARELCSCSPHPTNPSCRLRYKRQCCAPLRASGNYYARLFADRDTSGTYTPGSLTLNRMPEDVYSFQNSSISKKIGIWSSNGTSMNSLWTCRTGCHKEKQTQAKTR